MEKILIRYFLIFLFILTSSNALDDKDGNLNLQEPKKLNKIEGKITPLNSVKKELAEDIPSLKPKKLDTYEADIDTSKYTKVKLIDTVLETLSHSDLLKSSREKVIQYEIKVKNALSNYYPTLDFEYNLGRTRTFPGTDDTGKFKFFNDKNYKFVLRQNIYSGGATNYDVKSVAKKLEVAKNQYRITLDSEIKKSIKAYFGVVFANRSVMVNERNMKKLNKILEIVTIKYDNGAASIGDLTSIKASVANAMTKLVKVKSKFIESLRYYEYIAGIDFERTLPYEMNFDVNISSFDDLFERSLEKNRNLVNYYKSIEAEKFKQKKLESSFKPQVDFELSYKKTMDEEDLEEETNDLNGKFKLSYNIFNGGRDKNKVLEATSSIRDLKYRLSEEKRKLKWNLSKIHTSVESVREALKSTIVEIKASRKMVSAYWDAFKLGEQDLQILLQGQKQLNSAETELVKYEESHATDFFNILEITGDLATFFDVDPENTKFIDFSKSDYKKNIFVKDGTKISLDSKKEETVEDKEDILEKEIEKKEMEIPLPKPSIDENINNFLENFLNFDDESFMIEISDFGNIYESFDFIKANNFDTNSFSYDVVEKYNIKTRVAHNNFKTLEDAKEYLKILETKDLNKTYRIKKVKEIKSLYNKYKDGLKVKVKKVKPKIKVKVVEKIRQEIKRKDFLTNEAFKNKFLNSNDNYFTINVSSFTKNEKVEEFIKFNEMYEQSFFFSYGENKQLIKLVYGIYPSYVSLEQDLNKIIFENNGIYPVVEKVGLVKNLYNKNIELNVKKDKPIEYEYINLSKKQLEEKKNIKIKKDLVKNEKNEEVLTLTKRPTLDDVNKKEKEKIQEIKKKLEKILPTKKDLEKKLAEAKRKEELRLKEEARKAKELEEKRIAEEKAKLAKE
uniref:TolC family protein n=1 Tax=Arcobacter sp. LA11 TaxID=1898176 RepID=UPI0009F971F8